ncbi:bifunctional DNA primase/helicase [Bacteroides sp.]
MRNFHSFHIETSGRTGGKMKAYCPQCREQRRNKRDKSLSVNLDNGLCHCHHCGWSVCVPDSAELRERARKSRPAVPTHFHRPVFNPSALSLSERTGRWLVETRCIPASVVSALRITEQTEMMPQSGAPENCVCFNYFEDGQLVNVKYRSAAKHFKMVTGAELIPYNIDSILGTPECIITEGELDAASFLAIGRTDAVSVPSGANANLTWLDRFVETHFEGKRLVYIAVDTDAAGLKLRAELLRRLGAERCRIVTYGPGCKDANEHLVKYGADSLRIALSQAEEVPLEGVFTADDCADELRALYENGFGPGADTGWENFDKLCTLELQRLLVITGVPGSGKSEWVDEFVLRLCLRHDWRIGFFSPENAPITYHLRKLAEKLTACRFQPGCGMTEELYTQVTRYIADHVTHILPKESFTAETILSKGRELVARKGIRILVIDPLNRLEHSIPPGQTETQYLSTLLNQLSGFATRNHCLVVLVAHPRKMNRNAMTGQTPCPEMYDINGSADFYNKADFGLVVERDDAVGVVRVHVEKVKFKHLGQKGEAQFVYDPVSGRYLPCEEDKSPQTPVEQRVRGTVFDNSGWLNKLKVEN